jgi:hypothetical protein
MGYPTGDRISPYLSLLCVEALSILLMQADSSGDLVGAPTSKRDPSLNHLFFADDSLLFLQGYPLPLVKVDDNFTLI